MVKGSPGHSSDDVIQACKRAVRPQLVKLYEEKVKQGLVYIKKPKELFMKYRVKVC